MWYDFSNKIRSYTRHNKYVMQHYNDICKICDIPQITKIYTERTSTLV